MIEKEFFEILDQVKKKLHGHNGGNGGLNKVDRILIGLTDKDKVKTLPFNIIKTDVTLEGSYWIDDNGYQFTRVDDIKKFTEHSYKNNRQRIEIVRKVNKKIKTLKKKTGSPPSLITEYPVYFELERIPDSSHFPSIVIDNKTMFNNCLINSDTELMSLEDVTETAKHWNKAVLEHYYGKKAKKYRDYEEPFIEWFEDKNIDIKEVDSLIDGFNDSDKWFGDWTGTQKELIKELREDTDSGVYKNYVEAYRHAEKHITINGKPVVAKRLESNYHAYKSKGLIKD